METWPKLNSNAESKDSHLLFVLVEEKRRERHRQKNNNCVEREMKIREYGLKIEGILLKFCIDKSV